MVNIVVFFSFAATSVHAQYCIKKEFVEVPSPRYSTGTKLAAYKSTSKSLCELTCRLYLGCKAYLMKWQDATETGLGDCELYMNFVIEPSMATTHQRFYGYCPKSMTYNVEFGGCLRLFSDSKTWDEATAECKKIDPEAHLVGLTDERKQNAADALAESLQITTYFTDGKSKDPGSDTFVWSSSRQIMEFTNWWSEPTYHGGQEAFCVRVVMGKWTAESCVLKGAFICEY